MKGRKARSGQLAAWCCIDVTSGRTKSVLVDRKEASARRKGPRGSRKTRGWHRCVSGLKSSLTREALACGPCNEDIKVPVALSRSFSKAVVREWLPYAGVAEKEEALGVLYSRLRFLKIRRVLRDDRLWRIIHHRKIRFRNS